MLDETEVREPGRRTFARERGEAAPQLAVVDAPATAPSAPASQVLIDAVTQLEANKKDVSPRGFAKRLQLAYAIFDQASLMMQEIESQHSRLVADLVAVDRRTPLPAKK
jgi:hypothetical protein